MPKNESQHITALWKAQDERSVVRLRQKIEAAQNDDWTVEQIAGELKMTPAEVTELASDEPQA
jgi:hypothetical protein